MDILCDPISENLFADFILCHVNRSLVVELFLLGIQIIAYYASFEKYREGSHTPM